MHTTLDCIPCIVRQALESARFVTRDPAVHELLLRHSLTLLAQMDLTLPPPVMGQLIHQELRRMTQEGDPYREAKDRFNALALERLPQLRAQISSAPDPFSMAARMAIAGNIIDFGIDGTLTEDRVDRALDEAVSQPLEGDWAAFTSVLPGAQRILYIADNAGEILFDRLFIERLAHERLTLAVRGRPILNDATRADARLAGLDEIVRVIDNGSDAPGTILSDCNAEFVREFLSADLIIAKGQGNFETLSDEAAPVFFFFKAKCPVIATHAGVQLGALVVKQGVRSASLPGGVHDEERSGHV
jgi:uncharacterized protein with ATP-grasp and redox domains